MQLTVRVVIRAIFTKSTQQIQHQLPKFFQFILWFRVKCFLKIASVIVMLDLCSGGLNIDSDPF